MKRILTLVLGCAMAMTSIAETVYLNNGQIIRGTVGYSADRTQITVITTDGKTYTYPMIEVRSIVADENASTAVTTTTTTRTTSYVGDYTANNTGFWCAVEVEGAYSLNLSNANIPMTGLMFTGGYRFNDYFRIGLGAEARYFINNDKIRYSSISWDFPLFVNLRGNFMPTGYRDVVPYWSVDFGGAIRDDFMWRPTIGIRVGSQRSAFIVGLTYTGQILKAFKCTDTDVVKDNKYTSFLGLRLGYEF